MRKSKVISIDADNRDKGKTFLIVEKSAYDTEKWATRAILALGKADVEVSESVISAGPIGILLLGIGGLKKLPFEDAEPLLDEMLDCVHFVPDANRKDPVNGRPVSRPVIRPDDLNDGDIEELATLLTLRMEALELHLGFSPAAVLSDMAAALTSSQPLTSTSPEPAEQ